MQYCDSNVMKLRGSQTIV